MKKALIMKIALLLVPGCSVAPKAKLADGKDDVNSSADTGRVRDELKASEAEKNSVCLGWQSNFSFFLDFV